MLVVGHVGWGPALHLTKLSPDEQYSHISLGFFNRARQTETATFNKLERIGLPGKYHVRDLWRQKDLEDTVGSLKLTVPGHGVVLLKLTRVS